MDLVVDPNAEYSCSPSTKSRGFTGLMFLVINMRKTENYNELEKYIEDHPNELDAQNEKGWTALMIAARNSNLTSTERTVKILIEAGCDLNLQANEGWTALMLACRNSNGDSTKGTVKLLIDADCDLNLQDNEGWTALMAASRYSNNKSSQNTVKLLVDAGCDLNLWNAGGWTALMLASACSNTDSNEDTVNLLIQAGCDLNVKGNNGWTALMLASRYSNTDSTENTVKLLINSGCDLNIKNGSGLTALMLACQVSNTTSTRNTVELMINAGCDLNVQNNKGKTALMICDDIIVFNMLVHNDAYIDYDQIMTMINQNEKFLLKEKMIYASRRIQNEETKRRNYINIIQYVPRCIGKFKFKYGRMGQKIAVYNAKLKCHSPEVIYKEIWWNNLEVLDFLDIYCPEQLGKMALYLEQ